MNIYLEAFGIFFKIGAFTIGGGYAMVPLIENEIVTKRNWISKDDFVDLLAISQSAPGILAVNISIFIGYKLRGIRGSLVTALGTVLPSFIIILAIAMFFHNFKDNPTYLQGYPPGSGRTDCGTHFQYGEICQSQPVYNLDSGCFCPAYLVTGLLSYLDYYRGRRRWLLLGKMETVTSLIIHFDI